MVSHSVLLARRYPRRNGLPTPGATCWPNCDNAIAMASLRFSHSHRGLVAVTSYAASFPSRTAPFRPKPHGPFCLQVTMDFF